MDDLISRKALLEKLKEAHDYLMQDPEVDKKTKWREAIVYTRTCKCIESAPSVDAVEVVRCQDCKFMDDRKENWFCEVWGYYGAPTPNAYCSYGDRKEQGA